MTDSAGIADSTGMTGSAGMTDSAGIADSTGMTGSAGITDSTAWQVLRVWQTLQHGRLCGQTL